MENAWKINVYATINTLELPATQKKCADDKTLCTPHGTCDDTGADKLVKCKCKEDSFTGDLCEKVNCAKKDVCKNGRNCENDKCNCGDHFTGDLCETLKKCSDKPCGDRGECEEKDGKSVCKCKFQYTGIACQEKQKCVGNEPCKNDGECKEEVGVDKLIKCNCKTGFEGDLCETKVQLLPYPCCLHLVSCPLCYPSSCQGHRMNE